MQDTEGLREIKQRLQRAREQADRAAAQFQEVIAEVPSGIPHPDGVVRIRQAAAACQRTLREVQNASGDFAKFVSGGSSASVPALCQEKGRLLRAVERSRADDQRARRLLRDCVTLPEADYERLQQCADDARWKLHGVRLTLERHIVEHGCFNSTKAKNWKY
jgi:hypothetical protein